MFAMYQIFNKILEFTEFLLATWDTIAVGNGRYHRMKHHMMLILLMAIACLGVAEPLREGPAPIVKIDSGVLEGTRFGRNSNEFAFLGIPFAAPPVRSLRWKPPQPVQRWQRVRSVSKFSAACSQQPSSWWPEMAGVDQLETSEDCLYLNVWTTNLYPEQKRAVMVWIHGGGNVEGSSHVPLIGPALARKGVIVVSLDYRLGVLGYLAHPALTAESTHNSSGNYGLLDQIAALQWVQKNIGAFGGDPGSVTVFGESSGAEDVCHLLASPLSKRLIHRAILESGVCMDSLYSALRKPQNYYRNHGPGEKLGMRFTAALGIPNNQNALASLRALQVDKLLKASQDLQFADVGVVVDGWIVPLQPAVTFAKGHQARVPVLVGSNADETIVFGKANPLASENSRPKTAAEYRKWLTEEFGEFADDVWKEYPANSDPETQSVFVRIQTDYEFGFGAHRLARITTMYGQPAYLYYFSYVGRGPFAALGAFHSEEMMFIGDNYWKSWKPDDNDRKLAGLMGDYWTQFAKTGDPNRRGLPQWRRYDEKSEQCLELGNNVKARTILQKRGYDLFERILKARLAEIQGSDVLQ
jgi:para-nitrobenzyl esterase